MEYQGINYEEKKMKRSAFLCDMVNKANERFKLANITDDGNDLFVFVCQMLMDNGCYDGFNWYREDNGRVSVCPKEQSTYLRIY